MLTCPGRTKCDCQPVYRPLCKWWNGEAITGQWLFRRGCVSGSHRAIFLILTSSRSFSHNPIGISQRTPDWADSPSVPCSPGSDITARCSWDTEAIAFPHRLEDKSLVNGLMVRLCNVSLCWTALKSVVTWRQFPHLCGSLKVLPVRKRSVALIQVCFNVPLT